MSSIRRAITFSAVCVFVTISICHAQTETAFLRSTRASSQRKLVDEFAGHCSAAFTAQLPQLEAALRPIYSSLPKTGAGLIDGASMRYALHRLLVQRHGWYVKGLEPDGKAWNASAFWHPVQKQFPPGLQVAVDERLQNGGLSLTETTAIASLLEEVARKEARERVEWIFRLHDVDEARSLTRNEALDMIDTYVILYLSAETFHPASSEEAMNMLDLFHETWKGWPPLRDWLRTLQADVLGAPGDTGDMNFQQVLRIAEEFGARYALFDETECRSLKSTLMTIEGNKKGRVLLSSFYGMGMTEDTLFKFNEKVEYLRDLGVLDETDPNAPSVIIPNYVTSRPQCLEASQFYSTCCRNECEDLLGKVEEEFETSMAVPERVFDVIRKLSTNTVEAPRQLSASLVDRLNQVAAANDGLVPIHGRLFNQWMHHAFPRECPFPHETGTISPRAPEIWKQETGQVSTTASEEEMVCHVSGSCAGGMEGANAVAGEWQPSTDLPWTDTEELLAAHQSQSKARVLLRSISQAGLLIGVLFAAYGGLSSAVGALRGDHSPSLKQGCVF